MRREYKQEGLLPSGYRQLEYLQSTGTQYIDTGIKTITQKSRITCECNYLGGDTTSCLFGAHTPNVAYHQVNKTTTPNQFRLISRNGDVFFLYTDYSNFHIWDLVDKRLFIDSTLVVTGSAESAVAQLNHNLYIFCRNQENTANQFGSYAIKYFKIYKDGVSLDRDFIPALRKSDSKPGLYDIVNNVFYTNQGTGEFLFA